MKKYLDFINKINIYNSNIQRGINTKLDLEGYTGQDIEELINQAKGNPDMELIEALELVRTWNRMDDVSKKTPVDYFNNHSEEVIKKTRIISDVTNRFVEASKL